MSMKNPSDKTMGADRKDAARFLTRELNKAEQGDSVARVVRERAERNVKHPAQALNPYTVY